MVEILETKMRWIILMVVLFLADCSKPDVVRCPKDVTDAKRLWQKCRKHELPECKCFVEQPSGGWIWWGLR